MGKTGRENVKPKVVCHHAREWDQNLLHAAASVQADVTMMSCHTSTANANGDMQRLPLGALICGHGAPKPPVPSKVEQKAGLSHNFQVHLRGFGVPRMQIVGSSPKGG